MINGALASGRVIRKASILPVSGAVVVGVSDRIAACCAISFRIIVATDVVGLGLEPSEQCRKRRKSLVWFLNSFRTDGADHFRTLASWMWMMAICSLSAHSIMRCMWLARPPGPMLILEIGRAHV